MKQLGFSAIIAILRGLARYRLASCLTVLQLALLSPVFAAQPLEVEAQGPVRPQAQAPNSAAPRALGPKQAPEVCTDFHYIGAVVINPLTPDLHCDSLRFFDGIMSTIQSLTDTPLSLGQLNVSPPRQNFYGGENFHLSRLTVSYDETGIDWNQATKIVFTHEAAHLILDNFLAQKIPLLKELSALKEKNSRFVRAIIKMDQRLKGDPTCKDENSECRRDIERIIATAGVQMSGPRPNELLHGFSVQHKADLARLEAIESGYHELFADLTQALVYSHPAINNQASRLFGTTPEPCRTFNESLPIGFSSADAHCSLSAIRMQLWNEFVVPNLSNKKYILAKLADAIQREVSMQMYTHALTPSEQGLRLIQLLRLK